MQITLMHNPKAGRGEHGAEYLLGLLAKSGHETRYQSTKERNWEKALDSSADAIIVAGGDGTVGKIAPLLLGRGMPLGILPLGTANNIARTLGFTSSPEAMFPQLDRGRQHRFDVGCATGPWGKRYWFEGAGAGLLPDYVAGIGRLVKAASKGEPLPKDKELSRHISVLHRVLSCYEPRDWQITVDGEDVSGRYLLFETMNIRSIGPVLTLAPHARTDDGRLDFVVVRDKDRDVLAAYLQSRLRNETAEFRFESRHCRGVQIFWRGSSLHFDDKLWPAKDDQTSGPCHIEFTVQPSALQILRFDPAVSQTA